MPRRPAPSLCAGSGTAAFDVVAAPVCSTACSPSTFTATGDISCHRHTPCRVALHPPCRHSGWRRGRGECASKRTTPVTPPGPCSRWVPHTDVAHPRQGSELAQHIGCPRPPPPASTPPHARERSTRFSMTFTLWKAGKMQKRHSGALQSQGTGRAKVAGRRLGTTPHSAHTLAASSRSGAGGTPTLCKMNRKS